MIAGTFNEWFTLAHKSRTSDGQGGFTFSFVTYATEHGRMSHLGKGSSRSPEPNIGSQLEEWEAHIFYCRNGVAIQRGDQITDSSGVNYLVLGLRRPSARPIRHIEAECREVQQGQ
jgi:hypothetical protein